MPICIVQERRYSEKIILANKIWVPFWACHRIFFQIKLYQYCPWNAVMPGADSRTVVWDPLKLKSSNKSSSRHAPSSTSASTAIPTKNRISTFCWKTRPWWCCPWSSARSTAQVWRRSPWNWRKRRVRHCFISIWPATDSWTKVNPVKLSTKIVYKP